MGFTQTFVKSSPFGETSVIVNQSIIVGIVAIYIVWIIYLESRRVKAPRVGKNPWISGLGRARADFFSNSKQLTREGYARYKNSMFWIQTGDMERLVLSNHYLDELRRLPDSYLDSKQAVVERNLGWYNRVDVILKSTAHVDVCRTQLVQNLDKVTDGQVRDLKNIFQRELDRCFQDQEFHFYNAGETMLNIVNRSTAKPLVGEPLCYDEIWLRTSLETTVNTGKICMDLQRYPAIVRPLVYPFTEGRRRLNDSFGTAQRLLGRVIKGRKRNSQNIDILQWLIDRYEGDKLDVPFLTNQTLFVAIASTRSTATSIVNTLFDLLEFSQYQQPLRSEIDEAVRECGGWNLQAIQRMKKLDSFIKESQRLNHHLLLSFNRKVCRKVTLSDGLTIPSGTFISTSAYWTARDPDYFEGGAEFRPWRWLKLREAAERAGKSQTPWLATSTSPENLHWGYGRNACPGRFMAAAEIKLILAWILCHFEICFPYGQLKRPESHFVDERVVPSPTQKVGFRLRQERDARSH